MSCVDAVMSLTIFATLEFGRIQKMMLRVVCSGFHSQNMSKLLLATSRDVRGPIIFFLLNDSMLIVIIRMTNTPRFCTNSLFFHLSFHSFKVAMSARTAHKDPKKQTYLEMVVEAIPMIKDRKGASRQAIATWIQNECGKVAGSTFNVHLRGALKKGIESGILKEGNTDQRYRIGVIPKAPRPKKKVSSKKKSSSRKKTGSKKKGSSKKKKAGSKRKSRN